MKDWVKKEKHDAKKFNAHRTKGSGNSWYNPGDSRNDKYLIESKQTLKKSYSLNKDKLDKLYEQGLFTYKTPLLAVRIMDMDLIVVFEEDFSKLLENQTKE